MSVTLDLFEYPTDLLVQEAYVTSASGEEIVEDSYDETPKYTLVNLYDAHPGSPASAAGQAFTAPSTFVLSSVKFYMARLGNPTGNAYVRLYAATGTMGMDAKPTGEPLASSAGVDISGISTGLAFVTFDFSGDPYELQEGNDYCVIYEHPHDGDPNNKIDIQGGITPSAHSGNIAWYSGGWDSHSDYDISFYVYSIGSPPLQCHSENIIVQDGDYSLEGIAIETDSLNETLTRTISPTIDLSGLDKWVFYIYSNRTGSHIKVGLHDSGGVTTEHTPNVISAGVWQEVEVDVSGVADADKDAIDKIIITILNADADNTFYLDSMIAELGVAIFEYSGDSQLDLLPQSGYIRDWSVLGDAILSTVLESAFSYEQVWSYLADASVSMIPFAIINKIKVMLGDVSLDLLLESNYIRDRVYSGDILLSILSEFIYSYQQDWIYFGTVRLSLIAKSSYRAKEIVWIPVRLFVRAIGKPQIAISAEKPRITVSTDKAKITLRKKV